MVAPTLWLSSCVSQKQPLVPAAHLLYLLGEWCCSCLIIPSLFISWSISTRGNSPHTEVRFIEESKVHGWLFHLIVIWNKPPILCLSPRFLSFLCHKQLSRYFICLCLSWLLWSVVSKGNGVMPAKWLLWCLFNSCPRIMERTKGSLECLPCPSGQWSLLAKGVWWQSRENSGFSHWQKKWAGAFPVSYGLCDFLSHPQPPWDTLSLTTKVRLIT